MLQKVVGSLLGARIKDRVGHRHSKKRKSAVSLDTLGSAERAFGLVVCKAMELPQTLQDKLPGVRVFSGATELDLGHARLELGLGPAVSLRLPSLERSMRRQTESATTAEDP